MTDLIHAFRPSPCITTPPVRSGPRAVKSATDATWTGSMFDDGGDLPVDTTRVTNIGVDRGPDSRWVSRRRSDDRLTDLLRNVQTKIRALTRRVPQRLFSLNLAPRF